MTIRDALKCPHCDGVDIQNVDENNPFTTLDAAEGKNKTLLLRTVICNSCGYVMLFKDPSP